MPAQVLEGISSTTRSEGARDIMRGDMLAGRSKDLVTYPHSRAPRQLSVTCSTKFSELSFAGL